MVKRLATSPHYPLGITDSACKNQLVVVSVQYGPFNTYIPIRSTTIGKSRVARDPITMHTSWRLNSDIASVTSIGYPRMKASGESSTTKHRLLHASGPHPIPPPNDPKTNQYNQDLGLIHLTNGNHLESPNEGSLIDHQMTPKRRERAVKQITEESGAYNCVDDPPQMSQRLSRQRFRPKWKQFKKKSSSSSSSSNSSRNGSQEQCFVANVSQCSTPSQQGQSEGSSRRQYPSAQSR
ncbi:hypothetical protein F511_00165 [Dorcoceras hygrometricum]|nr:hypothetical protein F511_00165 [Dorcoceras hygrometricum]